LEVKTQLTNQDKLFILFSLVIVLNAALVSFQIFHFAAILISVLSYSAMIYIQFNEQFKQSRKQENEVNKYNNNNNNNNNTSSIIFFDLDNKKNIALNLLIFLVMPYFPIIYFLGYLKVLDSNNLLISYCIGSLLGKGVFCSYLSNSHVCLQSLLTKTSMKLEEMKRSNEMRNLIANVAHDLKTVFSFCFYFFIFFRKSFTNMQFMLLY
jgi:hypothetical protein